MKRVSPATAVVYFTIIWALAACNAGIERNVAARVGQKEITIEDLREFTEGTPVLLQSQEEGLAAVKDYLQTMVDMELMLHDARRQSLEQDADLREEYAKERETKLVQEYVTRVIAPTINITRDELRAEFKESKWSRMLRLAHIQTDTFEEAQAVVAELENGRSFEALARELSINETTAQRGGELEEWGFVGRDDLQRVMIGFNTAETLFDVPVGGYSQPYRRFERYEIFKVLEEAEAPDRYLHVFHQFLAQEKGDEKQLEKLQELKEKYSAKVDQEAVAFLVGVGSENALWKTSDEDKARTLVAYDGGRLTVGDFINTYWFPVRFKLRMKFEEEEILDVLDKYLLLAKMFAMDAVALGIDRKPAVADWLVDKEEALLINLYKDREVQAKVDSTEESIRKYYEENTHQFMDPNTTLITEVLVETREKADSLLQEVRSGADMQAMAVEHSTRMFSKGQEGQIHLHPFERAVFGPLHDQAMAKAPIGELMGPLELKEGFSIFRVEERTPATPQGYERSRSRAKYWLRKREERIHFEAMITGLRQKYAAEVSLYEDNLKDIQL